MKGGSSASAEFRGGRPGGGVGGSGKAGQARGEAKVAAERPAQCSAFLRAAGEFNAGAGGPGLPRAPRATFMQSFPTAPPCRGG